MAGQRYTGGGIMRTVEATRGASVDELREHTRGLATEMLSLGTTTIEIKSGYGLSVADEQRLLEVAREFTHETTFLGAHVVPEEYAHDRAAYVDLVAGEMLDACAPLARWIDVFCDRGAFTVEEARHILSRGNASRAGAASPRQPARAGRWRAAGGRGRRCERRSLLASERR